MDSRHDPPRDLPVKDKLYPIADLKARAVVVDMEEGVVNGMLKVWISCHVSLLLARW